MVVYEKDSTHGRSYLTCKRSDLTRARSDLTDDRSDLSHVGSSKMANNMFKLKSDSNLVAFDF